MVTEIRPGAVLAPPSAVSTPASVREILDTARTATANHGEAWGSPIATGFDLLDRVLEGGLRVHDLFLLGGAPGVGKTIAALQMARHAAGSGRVAVYLSYEHDEQALLGRLLVLELGAAATPATAPDVDRLRGAVVAATSGYRSLDELMASEPLLADAASRIDAYADRLWFVRGSGLATDVAAIEAFLPPTEAGTECLLVVDYLQKVAVHPEPADEAEKVTRVAESLKDLALRRDVACVALVAADWDGISGGRVRLHHLRGSSALGYECDVAVMMNEKHLAVARVHLAYDTVRAERFHHQVIFSVEKNRGGPAMVDLEFEKDFLHYRFVPDGRYLVERLSDDRLATE